MKLLFDQNISPRIVKHLEKEFPLAQQVRHLGLEDSSDNELFEFAKQNDYTIVTFDSDFVDLNVVKGFPPKIIWIRTGNLTTKAIAELLNENIETMQNFLDSDEQSILEIIRYAR